MITAAIVGLGRWGQTLVNAVQGKSDKLRFTHAVSRDPAQVRDFTTAHGLEAVGTLDAVLDDPASMPSCWRRPHSLHLAQIIAGCGRGKAVFCEEAADDDQG